MVSLIDVHSLRDDSHGHWLSHDENYVHPKDPDQKIDVVFLVS